MPSPKSICFVCLGNIVRSPLAEHLFQHLAEKRGISHKYKVDSAGTSDYHIGEPPDYRMRLVAQERGLEYSGKARQFHPQDLDRFDLIIAMDRNNQHDLLRLVKTEKHRRKIRLLREFDPQANHNSDVPDPYYGGTDGFGRVYQIIEKSVEGLLDSLENGWDE